MGLKVAWGIKKDSSLNEKQNKTKTSYFSWHSIYNQRVSAWSSRSLRPTMESVCLTSEPEMCWSTVNTVKAPHYKVDGVWKVRGKTSLKNQASLEILYLKCVHVGRMTLEKERAQWTSFSVALSAISWVRQTARRCAGKPCSLVAIHLIWLLPGWLD